MNRIISTANLVTWLPHELPIRQETMNGFPVAILQGIDTSAGDHRVSVAIRAIIKTKFLMFNIREIIHSAVLL